MKLRQLQSKIGGAILGFSLLFGIVIVASGTAQAQYQDDRRYEQDRRDRDRDYNDNYGRRRRNRDDRDQNRRGRRRASDGYGNYGGSFDLRQTALNEGFNEGLKEGRNDRRRGDYNDYTDEKEFQKGTKSYSSRLGDRSIYSRYFREAFSHGYADGYAGY